MLFSVCVSRETKQLFQRWKWRNGALRFPIGWDVLARRTHDIPLLFPSYLSLLRTSRLLGRTPSGRVHEETTVLVHVTNNVYAPSRECHSCKQNFVHGRKQSQFKLFFQEGSLGYVGMTIPDPSENQIKRSVCCLHDRSIQEKLCKDRIDAENKRQISCLRIFTTLGGKLPSPVQATH